VICEPPEPVLLLVLLLGGCACSLLLVLVLLLGERNLLGSAQAGDRARRWGRVGRSERGRVARRGQCRLGWFCGDWGSVVSLAK